MEAPMTDTRRATTAYMGGAVRALSSLTTTLSSPCQRSQTLASAFRYVKARPMYIPQLVLMKEET